MIDYTILGIKKRWCFSDAWMPEATTQCGLTHPHSVERIIMSDDAARNIQAMVASNQLKAALGVPLQLQKIEQDIPLSGFTNQHPLKVIMEPLKQLGVASFVRIAISRDRRASLPQLGREVYLQIAISLLDSSKKVITLGSTSLKSTSYVGVYPRELSSFALLLPNQLFLNQASGAGLETGDNYFKNFPSRAEAVKLPGIVFDSPVFVNADVILPPEAPTDQDGTYTPVSFNDRVIIGSGQVRRGLASYVTKSPGAESEQLWIQNREFGGFVKGVDLDGSSDAGLRALAGLAITTTPNANLMNTCINRNKHLADLESTKNSVLVGKLLDESNHKFHYRMALTDQNRFNRQYVGNWDPDVNNWDLLKSDPSIYTNKKAIAKVTIKIGDLTVTSNIGDEPGYIEIKPKVDLKNYVDSLKASVSSKKSQITAAENSQTTLESKISSLKNQLAQATSKLQTEEGKPLPPNPPDPNADPNQFQSQAKIDSLKDTIAQLQNEIIKAENDLNSIVAKIALLQQELASLEAQLDAGIKASSLQPVVRVEVSRPGTTDASNPTYRDFQINFTAPEALRYKTSGALMPVSFEIKAYDVSYYDTISMRGWDADSVQKKNTAFVKFNWINDKFVGSPYALDKNGVSRGDLPSDPIDLDLDSICSSDEADFSTAFDGADWSVSFAATARTSWDFTFPKGQTFVFDENNAARATKTTDFNVKSIAAECRIKATADFVSGFYVCDHLIIESRSTPLRIIGTFIALKMTIDDSAYIHGIRWSSIYNPMSTYELRDVGILRPVFNDLKCSEMDSPVWHPYPSQIDLANSYQCNPVSLRSKADPFTWTAVDPDCGLISNAKATTCKNRLINFIVVELSRDAGL